MEGNVFDDLELEKYVTKVLMEIGVPVHLSGYYFLRDAIIISEKDILAMSSVTKLLYPSVAKHFKSTGQKVERAIRNAIEVSWKKGNIPELEEIFGYSIAMGRRRPTNSEYIARLADKVRLDLREK